MKVFDTNDRDKFWNGSGFIIRDNNLILHQSADARQSVVLEKGQFVLKILARKRSGNGIMTLGISDSKDGYFLKKTLNITKSGWSENIFNFEINNDNNRYFFSLTRNQSSFGSVEIGRIIIERDAKIVLSNRSQDYQSSSPLTTLRFQNNSPPFYTKLAFVVPYKIYGGAEIYIKNLIENLNAESYQVAMLYLGKNDLSNYLIKDNISHQQVPTLKHLEASLIANNFDTIIYYNSLVVYQTLSSLVKRGLIRSNLAEIYHSDFSWAGAISNIKQREYIDKFFVVGESLGNDIIGLKPNSRIVLPVGIDVSRFNKKKNTDVRGQLGISFEDKIIGTVARLSKEKNIDYILELAKKMPDFYFVIVGDGPERANLEQIIKSQNLKAQLIGFKKNVEDYLSNFDAFILPSKMEGVPVTICEAMAAGVTVFANNVGAISDIVKNNETGFFLSGDSDMDSKLIHDQINNYDVISQARQYVLENHNVVKMVEKFTESIITVNQYYKIIQDSEDLLGISGEYV